MKTTKELALELGLVRKRSCATNQKAQKQRKRNQIFTYLVVIDFESTCWQNSKHIPNEIIEFPATLLNTATGEIESEFHHYVQPFENAYLSDFCKNLTGITQQQVDDGIPLSFCLRRFTHWLKKISVEKKLIYNAPDAGNDGNGFGNCTFVTWSDWDIGVCLTYECRRKQLRVPPELASWIDLRATYRKFYERKPKGLNGALQDVGITFEGREHSGLHDARNTAKLAWRMICDGCIMCVTKTVTTGHRSATSNRPAPSAIARSTDDKVQASAVDSTTAENSTRSFTAIRPAAQSFEKAPERGDCRTNQGPIKRTAATVENAVTATCTKASSSSAILPKPDGKTQTSVFKTPSPLNCPKKTPSPASSARLSVGRDITNLTSPAGSGPVFAERTPSPACTSVSSRMQRTPPLCNCGRRAARRFVQSPGANVGRSFFCCSAGQRAATVNCGFFQWGSSPRGALRGSAGTLGPRPPQPNFNTPQTRQKRTLGMKTVR